MIFLDQNDCLDGNHNYIALSLVNIINIYLIIYDIYNCKYNCKTKEK